MSPVPDTDPTSGDAELAVIALLSAELDPSWGWGLRLGILASLLSRPLWASGTSRTPLLRRVPTTHWTARRI